MQDRQSLTYITKYRNCSGILVQRPVRVICQSFRQSFLIFHPSFHPSIHPSLQTYVTKFRNCSGILVQQPVNEICQSLNLSFHPLFHSSIHPSSQTRPARAGETRGCLAVLVARQNETVPHVSKNHQETYGLSDSPQQTQGLRVSSLTIKTHCGLVMAYGDRDLGQHWFR